MNALVPSKAFDFSAYQAGDTIVINMLEVFDNKEKWNDFVHMITVECRRRKITWTMDHLIERDEVHIKLF